MKYSAIIYKIFKKNAYIELIDTSCNISQMKISCKELKEKDIKCFVGQMFNIEREVENGYFEVIPPYYICKPIRKFSLKKIMFKLLSICKRK